MSACLPLSTFTFQEQMAHSGSSGEFSRIMIQLALAGKLIAKDIRQAGLGRFLGSTGAVNVQGEEVKKLDERANQIFLEVFEHQELVSTLVSEEMEKPFLFKGADGKGKYAVFLDPLDGSSNTDVNAPLGSIFSIYRLSRADHPATEDSLRKKGSEQVAAGYFLYGPSVILVYTCGKGVYQFTLDWGGGEFFLTADSLKIPSKGSIYSVNEGNRRKWDQGVRKFLDFLQEFDPSSGRPYSGRYSGCLVADVHRILLKGGLYLYPAEQKKPDGKLRLMYEAAPLSFVVEQGGGRGSTGVQRVNDLVPQSLHQRVPLWIGSRDDVLLAESYHKSESRT
ncbi:MAG: class 1 fructose-bisphosphatase [Nitrospirales bacterium]|nr:class 1 fructose-bisphosphatase [Nitrospirales bacterium]